MLQYALADPTLLNPTLSRTKYFGQFFQHVLTRWEDIELLPRELLWNSSILYSWKLAIKILKNIGYQNIMKKQKFRKTLKVTEQYFFNSSKITWHIHFSTEIWNSNSSSLFIHPPEWDYSRHQRTSLLVPSSVWILLS